MDRFRELADSALGQASSLELSCHRIETIASGVERELAELGPEQELELRGCRRDQFLSFLGLLKS